MDLWRIAIGCAFWLPRLDEAFHLLVAGDASSQMPFGDMPCGYHKNHSGLHRMLILPCRNAAMRATFHHLCRVAATLAGFGCVSGNHGSLAATEAVSPPGCSEEPPRCTMRPVGLLHVFNWLHYGKVG